MVWVPNVVAGFSPRSLKSLSVCLLHDCLHHRRFEIGSGFLVGRLSHINSYQLFLRVNPEVSAEGAAPAKASFGQENSPLSRVADDAHAEPKALPAGPAGKGVRNVDGRHQFNGSRAEQPLSIRLSAVDQHQAELQIVFGGGAQSSATRQKDA